MRTLVVPFQVQLLLIDLMSAFFNRFEMNQTLPLSSQNMRATGYSSVKRVYAYYMVKSASESNRACVWEPGLFVLRAAWAVSALSSLFELRVLAASSGFLILSDKLVFW